MILFRHLAAERPNFLGSFVALCLKHVLQSQLHQPWIHRQTSDLPEIPSANIIRNRRHPNPLRPRVPELRMVEQVEELRAELQLSVLMNPAHARALPQSHVEVELARPQ